MKYRVIITVGSKPNQILIYNKVRKGKDLTAEELEIVEQIKQDIRDKKYNCYPCYTISKILAG